ncbi:MAG: hypothetical protein ACRD72_01920 [Candidatus Angelobacter sp.]
MENIKKDDRLAEAAREIFQNYGNNLQRYFDDLMGKTKMGAESVRCVDPNSTTNFAGNQKNGTNRRVP